MSNIYDIHSEILLKDISGTLINAKIFHVCMGKMPRYRYVS